MEGIVWGASALVAGFLCFVCGWLLATDRAQKDLTNRLMLAKGGTNGTGK